MRPAFRDVGGRAAAWLGAIALTGGAACAERGAGRPPAPTAPAALAPAGPAPSEAAERYAPGVLSTPDYELNASFAPDGRTVYFTKASPTRRHYTIVSSRAGRDGRWGEPEVAPFSGAYSDADPFVAPDGSALYFISNRPAGGVGPAKRDYDLWRVRRVGDGWGEPQSLGPAVNTDGDEFYVSVTRGGTVYFSARRPGGKGGLDVYRARAVGEGYAEPEGAGDGVNSTGSEADPYVAPDESFLIFTASGRPDPAAPKNNGGDLYVSFASEGGFGPAVWLGPEVNSPALEFCPIVSPDGRYLFFTSERGFMDAAPSPARVATYSALVERLRGPDNGAGDVYRIPLDRLAAFRGRPAPTPAPGP